MFSINAQEFGSNVIGNDKFVEVNNESTGFKPDVSVSLGTSFSSFAPGFRSFGTYVMPEFILPVSKKFAVRAGVGYSNVFYSTPANEGTVFGGNNLQYGTVYVSGIYQVNPKLTIAGTAYKTFSLVRKRDDTNPFEPDYSNEGFAINADYKVTEKFRINVGFSYRKQNPYNYYYSPGGFNMNPSPFYNQGFGSGFGPGF